MNKGSVIRAACIPLGICILCLSGCGEDVVPPFGTPEGPGSGIPAPAVPVLESAEEENKALNLTRAAGAPDGEGTNEDWARRKIEETKEDVLFPRWEARRRAAGKYEVTFTFTVVGTGESVSRRGFAWMADTVLLLVSPPREMQADELAPRALRVYQQRGKDRERIELIEE